MQFLIIYRMKTWVDLIKWRGGVPALAEDSPAVDVMQEGVELVRLIGEATVIQEHVLSLARILFHFWGDTDGGCGLMIV
jgi:hypothetical protein